MRFCHSGWARTWAAISTSAGDVPWVPYPRLCTKKSRSPYGACIRRYDRTQDKTAARTRRLRPSAYRPTAATHRHSRHLLCVLALEVVQLAARRCAHRRRLLRVGATAALAEINEERHLTRTTEFWPAKWRQEFSSSLDHTTKHHDVYSVSIPHFSRPWQFHVHPGQRLTHRCHPTSPSGHWKTGGVHCAKVLPPGVATLLPPTGKPCGHSAWWRIRHWGRDRYGQPFHACRQPRLVPLGKQHRWSVKSIAGRKEAFNSVTTH